MSSENITIIVKNLGKKYTIGGPQEPYHSFRDAKSQFIKNVSAIVSDLTYGCDGSFVMGEKL